MRNACLLLIVLLSACSTRQDRQDCSAARLQSLKDGAEIARSALDSANPQPDGNSRNNIPDEAAEAAARDALAQTELALALKKCGQSE